MQPLSNLTINNPKLPTLMGQSAKDNLRFGASAKMKYYPELGGGFGTKFEGVDIIGGARTPLGDHFGAFSNVDNEELAFQAAKGALAKTGISGEQIATTNWGCVIQTGQTPYLPKNILLRLGAPVGHVGKLINELCGSGLAAISESAMQAAQMDPDDNFIVLAGGTENMSKTPVSFPSLMPHIVAKAKKAGTSVPVTLKGLFGGTEKGKAAVQEIMNGEVGKATGALRAYLNHFIITNILKDEAQAPDLIGPYLIDDLRGNLTHKYVNYGMIDTAEDLREMFGIHDGAQLDEFAEESQHRAGKAITEGKFKDEIVPVVDADGKVLLAADEGVRGTSVKKEKLAEIRERQGKNSTIHNHPEKAMHAAPHASRITDGAAAVLIANEETTKRLGLNRLGKLLAIGRGGANPKSMGYGAAQASKVAIKTAGLDLKQLVKEGKIIFEVNEAFAAVALAWLKDISKTYDIPETELRKITNVNGGAIALGHPLGASGARLPLTGLLEANRSGVRYVLTTLCEGGGGGIAGIFEVDPAAKSGQKA